MMRVLILITMLMGSGFSYAEEVGQNSASSGRDSAGSNAQQGSRSATREWLELQRSGQAASDQPQPISGEAMGKIHERYINSFSKPIPEFYDHTVPIIK